VPHVGKRLSEALRTPGLDLWEMRGGTFKTIP
jgi:hypothetical protein